MAALSLASCSSALASCPCIDYRAAPPEVKFQAWADRSALVFEASAESVVSTPRQMVDGYPEASRTTVLQIFKVWKGVLGARVVLESSSLFDCAFGFQQGPQYLVFASIRNGKVFVEHCMGTIPLEEAGEYLRYYQNSTGAVCGSVRDSRGDPAVGAFVSAWIPGSGKNQFVTYQTPVGSEGEYLLGLLKPGKYPLVAEATSEKPPSREVGWYRRAFFPSPENWTVEVQAGQRYCGFDIKLVRQPLRTVRGRIQTEDGSPLPNECTAYLRGLATGHPFSFSRYVRSNASGSFEFVGVPNGSIYAYATCFQGDENTSVWRGTSVWVKTDAELVLTIRRIQPLPLN